jgi:hypothetical protein
MPVAGGPKITTTGILLEVDAADKTSYSGTGTTWTNQVRPGTFNGTLNNISFNSTDAKGALVFTGSNTFVDFGNLGPSLTSSFSFQVAFKPAATASGQPYTILSYASSSATSSITFKLDYTSSNQTVVLTTFAGTGSQNIVYAISASAASGSWNVVHGTFGSQLAALYVNGLGQAYAPTTGSVVGYNTANRLYAGLNFGSTVGYFTGSIGNITVNNADLDGLTVNKNYNAIATRFSLPIRRPIVTDADVFDFVEAAGIVDPTQQAAVNTLVIGLKANNLWTKMQAIYPFVGGTAFSHKWNLKNPRDLNTSFRLQYFGTVSHTSLGISGSSNGYADTYYFPLTSNTEFSSSIHLSAYTITHNNYSINVHGALMGNVLDQTGLSLVPNYTNNGNTYYQLNFPTWKVLGGANSNNVGFYIASRTTTTNVALYRRINTGNTLTTATELHSGTNNNSIRILGAPGWNGWSGTVGFASLGYGLSADDAINLDTIVSAYQTALGRKPF